MVEIWNFILLQPVLNFSILLSNVLFHSFGLAIIALTIIVRLVMWPLTMKQLRSSKAMSELQPKLKAIQKKYAKDKQKQQQEISKLYKEAGVSPLGCLWPMLIQFPIWIALYQSVLKAVAASPEALLGLSQNLYSLSLLHQAVPLESGFLWLNLGRPDAIFILPILVGGTMWIQQKMMILPTIDPKQRSMSRMMLWMMPLFFAYITLMFPSGLALFWVVSNIIGVVMQYFVTGWGGLEGTVQRLKGMKWKGVEWKGIEWKGIEWKRIRWKEIRWKEILLRAPAPISEPEKEPPTEEAKQEERVERGKPRGKRKDRRRGRRTRP